MNRCDNAQVIPPPSGLVPARIVGYYVLLTVLMLIGRPQVLPSRLAAEEHANRRIAGVTTVYYHNSHADMFFSRMLEGYNLDGKGDFPKLKLVSLFLDQFPDNDKGRSLAAAHHVPIFPTIGQAITLGGAESAVDGILLIAEHGKYAESDTGQFAFPKRAMFAQVASVCERSQRPVPVFLDKQLADNWADAKWIYDESQRVGIPLMAGSSLPVTWRYPPVDVDRDQPLSEIVALSYHRLDSYGFHALEIVQCLAERRRGGETGVRQVRTLRGNAVWPALDAGILDRQLLDEAAGRLKNRPIPNNKRWSDLVKDPVLFTIDYRDGLRASVLSLGDLYIEWAAAWRYADHRRDAALFWTQEERPLAHFSILIQNLEPFFQTGKPTWPAERTLLTTGVLDALLISHRDEGRIVPTPHLAIEYSTRWDWRQPPAPPIGRPLSNQ